MYAIIESGGKQYRVEVGAEIRVDRLDVSAGDLITFDRVLLVADGEQAAIGQPHVNGATVKADVVAQERGDKIVVFKYKPKARRRVKKGFRAELTTLRISDIDFGGRSAASDVAQEAEERSRAARAAEKAAADQALADQALAAQLAADLPDQPATDAAAPKADAAPSKGRPSGRAAAGKAPPDPAVEPEAGAAEPAAAAETASGAPETTEPAPAEASAPGIDAADSSDQEGTTTAEAKGAPRSRATRKDT